MYKKINRLKHCVRSQITCLKLQKNILQLSAWSDYSTYSRHHKLLLNRQVSNTDAVKNGIQIGSRVLRWGVKFGSQLTLALASNTVYAL